MGSYLFAGIMILWFVLAFYGMKKKAREQEKNRRILGSPARPPQPERHRVSPIAPFSGREEQDITCEALYGHEHEGSGRMYIVREKPEAGYVILNGKKRRIKDLKNY